MLTDGQHIMPWGEEEPRSPPKPKPKRPRQARPRRPPAPQLPLSAAPMPVDCKSKPGICLTLNCRWQLISEVRIHVDETGVERASLHIYGSPGVDDVTMPEDARTKHRKLRWEDTEACAKAVVARADYLYDLVGTTCSRDLHGLTLKQIAALEMLTSERVRQVESAALRKLRRNQSARAAWEEWTEEPRPARFTGLVQIRRRGA